jgi:hypothetical protein
MRGLLRRTYNSLRRVDSEPNLAVQLHLTCLAEICLQTPWPYGTMGSEIGS